MNLSTRPPDDDIPVVCSVCNTRLYASADQLGQMVTCPDCQSKLRVVAPPAAAPKRPPKFTGDEYRLAADDAPPSAPTEQLVKVVCGTCYSLMYAKAAHVGKRVRCPECGAANVVPRPPDPRPAFQLPDASDVLIEESPPPLADEKRKEIADRLMAEAKDHAERRASERPKPVTSPLRTGIYSFPFYPNVLPLWIGASLGALLNLKIFEVLLDVINGGGYMAIMAAFLAPILALCVFAFVALVAPHLVTIIEYTADGYDRIPYWPPQDFLSRLQAVVLGVNALAMSTMPGMLIVGPLNRLGVPLTCGLISTVLLLPLVLLSMLENNSIFLPFSPFVFRSVSRHRGAWQLFYLHAILLAIGIVLLDFLVWQVDARASKIVTTVSICLYVVIYSRLVGRIAWILAQDTDHLAEDELEDESDLDEREAEQEDREVSDTL